MAEQWSKAEEDFLRENYEKMTLIELSKKLNRSKSGTQHRLLRLGLKRRELKTWTKKDIQILKDNYPTKGYDEVAILLNRSKDSVYQKAKNMNLRRQYPYHKFTKEFLEQEYLVNKKSVTEIAQEHIVEPNDVYMALYKNAVPIQYRKQKGSKHHNWQGFGEIHQTQWGDIIYSAKDRNIKFDITIEYTWSLFLQQDRKCALSGEKLYFSERASRYWENTTASLDRIDSHKGYIKGNVQWVNKKINRMKMDLDEYEFIHLCNIISIHNKDRDNA